MNIQKRLTIAGIILTFLLILYGAGRYNSPSLIRHVVEQSLMQKAPAGTDPALLQKRLDALLSGAPDQKAQMEQLFRISRHLEKVQSLTQEDLDRLLAADAK